MKKRKRNRATITRNEAVRRLKAMLKAVRRDVEMVVSVEAAMEAANVVVTATANVQRPGASTFTAIHQSLALNLAMSLSRLYDAGSKRYPPNKRELASIPLIVRLLRQKRCEDALASEARQWTPQFPQFADSQEEACRQSCRNAVAAFDQLRRDPSALAGMRRLRSMRNRVMAHSFMDEATAAMPTYNQLFRLADTARQVTTDASLTISGLNLDMAEVTRIQREEAERFWRYALRLPSAGDMIDESDPVTPNPLMLP